MLDKKIKDGLENCLKPSHRCCECPYDKDENGDKVMTSEECKGKLYDDLMAYIDDCENVIKLLEETT